MEGDGAGDEVAEAFEVGVFGKGAQEVGRAEIKIDNANCDRRDGERGGGFEDCGGRRG